MPDPRGHPRRAAAARRRRHAVRLVPGLRRGRRSRTRSGSSRRPAPTRSSSRAPGRRSRACARSSGAGMPGDGPHRPDAAVGDDARRLQGAGPDGGEGAAAATRTRSRSRRPAASRSCSRPCPHPVAARITRGAVDPDDRDRRRRGLRRPGARLPRPARAVRGRSRRASSSSTPTSRAEIRGALEAYAAEVRVGRVPGGAAHVLDARGGAGRCSRRRRSSRPRAVARAASAGDEGAAARPRRAYGGQLQPCDDLGCRREQRERPRERSPARATRRPSAPAPVSEPPRRKTSSP